jgi:hypothetical protein
MPILEKRLAANRANAKLSRGPTSAPGKRISARNGSNQSDLSKVILFDGKSAAALTRSFANTNPNSSQPPAPSGPSSKA